MSIDFATFSKVYKYPVEARYPVLLRGRHGIGKSQLVYQIAEEMDLPVVERRTSQMTEGDLLGLPSIDGNSTTFNPPDWFKEACQKPVVLFFDELDRAIIEVRQGIFELTDSRKLNGHNLHPDTLIFAAINGGEDGSQYQVGEMDPAELDRFTTWDVKPTVEDWLSWAKGKVHPIVWDYINTNHDALEHQGEFQPNKMYPSRRSWHRLSNAIPAQLLDTRAFDDLQLMMHISEGFVGQEIAANFVMDFVRNYEKQVAIEDILDNGMLELVESFDINDHTALLQKMEARDVFKCEITDNRLANLARYMFVIPSEVVSLMWGYLGEYSNGQNSLKIHSMEVDGCTVGSFISSLLKGGK
jgi:hypothetical protein